MKAAEDRYNYLDSALDALDMQDTSGMSASERLKNAVLSESMRDEFFELRSTLERYYRGDE